MILLEYSIRNAGRIKAVSCQPKPTGLTIIGGKNRQGKTTNLDMLCWALGGDKYKPIEPTRRGSATPAEIDIKTDNGLHIQRKGKTGALHVTDETTGRLGNQTLLDKFITTFALDVRAFRDAKAKDKCGILLKTLGVDAELAVREQRIKEAYDERTIVNRQLKQREGALAQVAKPADPPIDEPINVDGLIAELQKINAANAARRSQITRRDMLQQAIGLHTNEIERMEKRIAELRSDIARQRAEIEAMPEIPAEQDASALQGDIADANRLNSEYAKVQQQRQEYDRLAKEATAAREAAQNADAAVEQARQARMDLLAGVTMPDPDIGVEDGELTYKGDKWDQLADSDELILCCKIVSKLNPECRFLLVDGLEKLDPDTLMELDKWVTDAGLQVIGTRVTTDPGEADLIIEDGQVAGNGDGKE